MDLCSQDGEVEGSNTENTVHERPEPRPCLADPKVIDDPESEAGFGAKNALTDGVEDDSTNPNYWWVEGKKGPEVAFILGNSSSKIISYKGNILSLHSPDLGCRARLEYVVVRNGKGIDSDR